MQKLSLKQMETIQGGSNPDRIACGNQAMGGALLTSGVAAIGASFLGPFSLGAAAIGFGVSLAWGLYNCHVNYPD